VNATPAPVGSDRDRRIHGAATIACGLVWGGYIVYSDHLTNLALLGTFVLACAIAAWATYLLKERADTAPRHSAHAVLVGFSASLAVFGVMPLLPGSPFDQPARDAVAAASLAAPIVLAGLWILRRK
jgi:hypothetical protein